ncbi:MAG: tetratricopeptide repeat protein [Bacteroidota bacterium]
MKKSVIVLFVIAVTLTACSTHDKLVERIRGMEKEISADKSGKVMKEKSAEIVRLYESFANRYPEDTLAPAFLFSAGVVTMNSGQPDKAIEMFSRVSEKYPKHKRAAEACFFTGFIYENTKGNVEKARDAYLDVVKKYPESDLVDDANFCIQNLGKTPEQVQKQLEENIKRVEDSIAATQQAKK